MVTLKSIERIGSGNPLEHNFDPFSYQKTTDKEKQTTLYSGCRLLQLVQKLSEHLFTQWITPFGIAAFLNLLIRELSPSSLLSSPLLKKEENNSPFSQIEENSYILSTKDQVQLTSYLPSILPESGPIFLYFVTPSEKESCKKNFQISFNYTIQKNRNISSERLLLDSLAILQFVHLHLQISLDRLLIHPSLFRRPTSENFTEETSSICFCLYPRFFISSSQSSVQPLGHLFTQDQQGNVTSYANTHLWTDLQADALFPKRHSSLSSKYSIYLKIALARRKLKATASQLL